MTRKSRSGGRRAANLLLPDTLVPSILHGTPNQAPPPAPSSPEEEERQVKADGLLIQVENNMMALTRAAHARWRPRQDAIQTNETEGLVFSDDDYANFLDVVEAMGEAQLLRLMGSFFDLPDALTEEIIQELLKCKTIPNYQPKRSPQGPSSPAHVTRRTLQ